MIFQERGRVSKPATKHCGLYYTENLCFIVTEGKRSKKGKNNHTQATAWFGLRIKPNTFREQNQCITTRQTGQDQT